MMSKKVVLIGSALVSGAINTLGYTLQNKQYVVQGNIHKHFFHPYMQVAMRFLSNLLSLFLYFALQLRNKQNTANSIDSQQGQQQLQGRPFNKSNLLFYIVPTLLDYTSFVCYYTALNFIPGSVYQILRGGTILTTFLFSYRCLGSRPTPSKIIGCTIILLGLVGVGIVNFVFSTSSVSEQVLTLVGYGLILAALFGNGLHFVCQQYLITKYDAKPLFIVGMQGLYGTIISCVLIPLLGLAHCSFGVQACVFQQSGSPMVQSITIYIRQVFDNPLILSGVIFVLFSTAVYNSLGVVIAKQMNSLTRSICDASRTVIIWFVGIIVSACMVGNTSFQWQSLEVWQLIGESCCFAILIVGNLVYYGMIQCRVFQREIKNETLIEQEYEPSITTES